VPFPEDPDPDPVFPELEEPVLPVFPELEEPVLEEPEPVFPLLEEPVLPEFLLGTGHWQTSPVEAGVEPERVEAGELEPLVEAGPWATPVEPAEPDG
jgi:hypothetical protein